MGRRTRKRSKLPANARPQASGFLRAVRRLFRFALITGTMALLATATSGSIYPKQTAALEPPFSRIDVVNLVKHLANPPDTRSPPVGAIAEWRQAGFDMGADRAEPVLGSLGSNVTRALRTESVEKTRDRLQGPRVDPRLQLVDLSPPYALSRPGSYQTRLAYATGRIEHSLYEAGQAIGLPDTLIRKLADIFGWDIDFALDLRAGDSFSVIYEQGYWFGRKIVDGPIVAAEFINQGDVYRAVGFRNEAGRLVYYTPTGHNLKRPFLRTPVRFSPVSSRFSQSRYHPILKLWRAHTGVDYAAAVGTPVRVTAAGTVASIGWNGGYGRAILVQHAGPYSTLYAHLSRYRRGLRVGSQVEQGEVIGYVGESGLATGPHVHYEFRVNGQYRNPLTYDFPEGDSVAPDQRAEFLRSAHEWVAQLDRMSEHYLASR